MGGVLLAQQHCRPVTQKQRCNNYIISIGLALANTFVWLFSRMAMMVLGTAQAVAFNCGLGQQLSGHQ